MRHCPGAPRVRMRETGDAAMGAMEQLFEREKMVLIASLPRNDPRLALAACQGGAHAVKVHLNVSHAASGTHFGSFTEEKAAIAEILSCVRDLGCAAGVMPGTDAACAAPHELAELAAMGVSFLDIYHTHIPDPGYLDTPGLDPMPAIGHGFAMQEVDALAADARIHMLEASVVDHTLYGQDLTPEDFDTYRAVKQRFQGHVIVPTQKKIRPDQVRALYAMPGAAGPVVTGLMIGAIVAGKEPGSFQDAARAFRDAIDAL